MWEYLARAPTLYNISPKLKQPTIYSNKTCEALTISPATHVSYHTSEKQEAVSNRYTKNTTDK
jgi:hypothetical protein